MQWILACTSVTEAKTFFPYVTSIMCQKQAWSLHFCSSSVYFNGIVVREYKLVKWIYLL